MREVFRRWKIYSTLIFVFLVGTYIINSWRALGGPSQEYLVPFAGGLMLFLIYYLITLGFLFRLEFLTKLDKLADELGFSKDFHMVLTPKMAGMHKDHKYKIEYWYKTTGHDPSMIRTYVKVYFRRPMEFDEKALERVFLKRRKDLIALHYTKEKNYLIAKLHGEETRAEPIRKWMDFLLEVAAEAGKESRT